MNKKNIRIGVIVAAALLSIVSIFQIDYQDLSWGNNSDNYRPILIGLLLTANMWISIAKDAKAK